MLAEPTVGAAGRSDRGSRGNCDPAAGGGLVPGRAACEEAFQSKLSMQLRPSAHLSPIESTRIGSSETGRSASFRRLRSDGPAAVGRFAREMPLVIASAACFASD